MANTETETAVDLTAEEERFARIERVVAELCDVAWLNNPGVRGSAEICHFVNLHRQRVRQQEQLAVRQAQDAREAKRQRDQATRSLR